jgi:hypothetical protein
VSNSGCKGKALKDSEGHAGDQDCIQYSWVEGDTLHIKHVNAAFNCCPGNIMTDLKVSGDTLILTESESSNLCDCNCLFDLDFIITGVPKGTWWIRVGEPYIQQSEQPKILFKVELKQEPLSEFCITRTGYPWRM